jgi:glycosyltransferase involved in cell wall biosynthesis
VNKSSKPHFRFHVVGLPHTQTTNDFNACAYTMKVVKFCRMMKSLGHEVFLYASEDNEAPCDELITVISKKEQAAWFGAYDFRQAMFKIEWNETLPQWTIPNARAIATIKERAQERDFICLIGGTCQKQIADGLPGMMSVEYGIGYYGVFAPFRVYESYAQMHYVHGQLGDDNGRFFDAVIPNYFDPDEFTFSAEKDDYYLYIGRFIPRKGPDMAVEVTKRIGAKLLLAGQGIDHIDGNRIIGEDGMPDAPFTLEGEHIKHVGYAGIRRRSELMSRAKAVFVCSYYLEPFGGTSIEPLFCGTPVITTDWGAFPENILDGKVGYRVRTIGEAVWAAKHVGKLNPSKIRDYAIKNFSLDRVRMQYQAYFEQLYTLWDDNGWYADWHRGTSEYHRYRRL